ncbi:MAG TPA: ABC transporter permease [Candidatus Udaeobacter sp.]|jgi:ABC-2 type transport system permease protein|nr:ABC transporter permease [Candidatus Udaeobacter sp.]
MSDTAAARLGPAVVSVTTRDARAVSSVSVFMALLRRDMVVARRELISFLVRTALQPLLGVMVFGFLLPHMGFAARGYTATLLPGILAISLAFASLQAVAFPMMADFGYTKEIEDRLLAPVPIGLIAFEKVISGIIQGLIVVAFVLPVARLIMGPIAGLSLQNLGGMVGVALLGAAAFASLGLWLGTAIPPQQIGLMFAVILAPMIFFGCAYYPWAGLRTVPVMQIAVLINPLVYLAEGMRGALTPKLPHMPLAVTCSMLVAMAVLLWWAGLKSFIKRAMS